MGLLQLLLFAAQLGDATPSPPAPDVAVPGIEVYTMGLGNDVFAHFGHAAICVERKRVRCYNFGTADFSTPVPLTWNFIRGRAQFWVSLADRQKMIDWYIGEDRTVWKQRLTLTSTQAERLARSLEASVQGDNKYYLYHHFDDNCTTRIRDLLDEALDGELKALSTAEAKGPTFREYAERGFAGDALLLVSANLVLGRSSDLPTTNWQGMFLPEVFKQEIATRLGAAAETVYQERNAKPSGGTRGGWVLMIVVGAVSLALGWAWGERRWVRVLICLLPGLLGLALWGLALSTTFVELKLNENLLVLVPFDLGLVVLSAERARSFARARLVGLALVLLLMLVGVLLQPLFPAIVLAGAPLLALARSK